VETLSINFGREMGPAPLKSGAEGVTEYFKLSISDEILTPLTSPLYVHRKHAADLLDNYLNKNTKSLSFKLKSGRILDRLLNPYYIHATRESTVRCFYNIVACRPVVM
jgi:hypothetical protein